MATQKEIDDKRAMVNAMKIRALQYNSNPYQSLANLGIALIAKNAGDKMNQQQADLYAAQAKASSASDYAGRYFHAQQKSPLQMRPLQQQIQPQQQAQQPMQQVPPEQHMASNQALPPDLANYQAPQVQQPQIQLMGQGQSQSQDPFAYSSQSSSQDPSVVGRQAYLQSQQNMSMTPHAYQQNVMPQENNDYMRDAGEGDDSLVSSQPSADNGLIPYVDPSLYQKKKDESVDNSPPPQQPQEQRQEQPQAQVQQTSYDPSKDHRGLDEISHDEISAKLRPFLTSDDPELNNMGVEMYKDWLGAQMKSSLQNDSTKEALKSQERIAQMQFGSDLKKNEFQNQMQAKQNLSSYDDFQKANDKAESDLNAVSRMDYLNEHGLGRTSAIINQNRFVPSGWQADSNVEFNRYAHEFVLNNKPSGLSRLTNFDIQYMEQTMANSTNTQEANRNILKGYKVAAQDNVDISRWAKNALANGMNKQDVYNIVGQYRDEVPFIRRSGQDSGTFNENRIPFDAWLANKSRGRGGDAREGMSEGKSEVDNYSQENSHNKKDYKSALFGG